MLAAGRRRGRRNGASRSWRYAGERLAPYKRIRRIEFADLPKTISGKIRRVELRGREGDIHGLGEDRALRASPQEFWEDDFPDLKG